MAPASPTRITFAEMREQGVRSERPAATAFSPPQMRKPHSPIEIAQLQEGSGDPAVSRPIIFTCPITNERVQHWPEDRDDVPEDEHEGVDCPACSMFHFIHRRSGKVLGHEAP